MLSINVISKYNEKNIKVRQFDNLTKIFEKNLIELETVRFLMIFFLVQFHKRFLLQGI